MESMNLKNKKDLLTKMPTNWRQKIKRYRKSRLIYKKERKISLKMMNWKGSTIYKKDLMSTLVPDNDYRIGVY